MKKVETIRRKNVEKSTSETRVRIEEQSKVTEIVPPTLAVPTLNRRYFFNTSFKIKKTKKVEQKIEQMAKNKVPKLESESESRQN